MKKIVPMTLILLMFASVFANMAWVNLNEEENSEATDGRAAQDAAIVGIHEPRASKLDPNSGEWRNTVKAGDDVNIIVAIQNAGDQPITEMNVEATIYLEDGTVAVDAGPDGQLGTSDDSTLSWTDSVICDVCYEPSLASGEWLDGGSYSIRDSSGNPISWEAPLGSYTIAVEVDLPEGDENDDNDMFIVDVQVVNWYDIGVSLEWDDGADTQSGAGVHDFTLTVTSDGSENWSARNVTVELTISESPTGTLTAGVGTSTLTAGSSQTVEIFFNETAPCLDPGEDQVFGTADDGPCDPRNGDDTRTVVDYKSSWTHSGSLEVSGNGDGSYIVSAALREYTLYGAAIECLETWSENTTDPETGETMREEKSSYNLCEVPVSTDDNSSNNEDDIVGYIGAFHDIALTSVAVAQGYDSMGQGDATVLAFDGDIGVGFSKLYASVEHRGSADTGPYDWEVAFTVTDLSDDSTTTYTADECLGGVGEPYTHDMIGDTRGQPFGHACVDHTFSAGKYKVEAVVSMINGDGTTDDENSANDDSYGVFDARNNDPTVTVSLQNQGAIKVGDILTLDASAFDAEDITGTTLTYEWNRITADGISAPIAECNADAENPNGYQACITPVDQSWATKLPVTVKVSDPHGGEDSATVEVMVWNIGTDSGTSGDGAVTVEYSLSYNAASAWTINVTDGTPEVGVELGGQSVDSLYVLDLTLARMDAADVLDQSLTVTFPGSADEDYSLYYKKSGTNWALLSANAVQVDSVNMSFEWTGNEVGDTLSAGSLGIFNVAADTGDHPVNGVENAWYVNLAGGDVVVKWNLTNNGADLLSTDYISVCTLTGCSTKLYTETQHTLSGNHGDVHEVTVSVNNSNGHHPSTKSFTATADGAVDPVPSIDFGAVENGSAAWTVGLSITDAGDAETFYICWKDAPFSAAQLTPTDLACVEADKADSSVDVSKPAVSVRVVYHFAIYAEDTAGNILATDASTTIERWGTSSGNTDTDGTLGEDLEAEQGVPTWAWGVIIGIVVVAFGIGAFILSRGGEGGEGKEWDY